MAQHDYTIANQGFPAFRSDLNDALAAIVSNNSGATEPTTMFAHQMWVDTAANPSVLKIRNADNDAWITIGTINQTGDTFTLTSAVSATTLNTSGAVVFNDAGADVDFRVEGDTDANLLFVDASSDNVFINTTLSAGFKFGVNESSAGAVTDVGGFFNETGSNATSGQGVRLILSNRPQAGTGASLRGATIEALHDGGTNSHALAFSTNASSAAPSERMRITSAGEVFVGGTGSTIAGSKFEVTGGPAAIISMGAFTGGGGVAGIALTRNDTTISNGNPFGRLSWNGNDTTSNAYTTHAYIEAVASGTHAAGDNPTDLVFGVTADGTETVFEALRITQNGTLDSQDTYDNTQTGSTVVVTSAGLIGRTSSSIKYKKDVETLNAELVDNAIANLRPVWYRTKDAKGDDKETWSHIGLIAEEVHEVEPRLVRYRTEKVEFVDVEEQVTKTREVSPAVTDEEGNVVQEAVTEEYTETVTRKEKQKTPLETPEPEDVDYGRLAVLCLAKIQQQEQTIAALEARIAALEA